jgi:hypothetical protein
LKSATDPVWVPSSWMWMVRSTPAPGAWQVLEWSDGHDSGLPPFQLFGFGPE